VAYVLCPSQKGKQIYNLEATDRSLRTQLGQTQIFSIDQKITNSWEPGFGRARKSQSVAHRAAGIIGLNCQRDWTVARLIGFKRCKGGNTTIDKNGIGKEAKLISKLISKLGRESISPVIFLKKFFFNNSKKKNLYPATCS
jgi:hypothetical protein